jgi:sulfopyruvate decarboxylase TPP-binding subunit
VLVQNSGLGNMINPLTSLVLPYQIPLLVLTSMRGWPDAGQGDEHHFWMGRVAQDWLRSSPGSRASRGATASRAARIAIAMTYGSKSARFWRCGS